MRICNQCNLLSVGSGKFCPRCGSNTFNEVDDSTISLSEELDYLAFVHGDDVLFEDRRLLSLLEDSFSATYLERIALKGAFRCGAVAMLSNWQTESTCFDSAYSVMMQEMSDTFSSLVDDAYRYVLVGNGNTKHDVSSAVNETLECSQDGKRELMRVLARQIKELAMKKSCETEAEAPLMHDISDDELIAALNKTLYTLDYAAFSIERKGYSVAQVDNLIDTLKEKIVSVRDGLENKVANYAALQIELNNCIDFTSESTFDLERHGYATDKVQLLSQRVTAVLSIINNDLANRSNTFEQESDTTSRIDSDAVSNHRIELDDEPLPNTPIIADQFDNSNNADNTYNNEATAYSDEEDMTVNDWSDVWKTF